MTLSPAHTQLILDITDEMREVIDNLVCPHETHAEMMYAAIALLQTVRSARRRNYYPALVDQDHNIVSHILGT